MPDDTTYCWLFHSTSIFKARLPGLNVENTVTQNIILTKSSKGCWIQNKKFWEIKIQELSSSLENKMRELSSLRQCSHF